MLRNNYERDMELLIPIGEKIKQIGKGLSQSIDYRVYSIDYSL